jgi:hypothetical protein
MLNYDNIPTRYRFRLFSDTFSTSAVHSVGPCTLYNWSECLQICREQNINQVVPRARCLQWMKFHENNLAFVLRREVQYTQGRNPEWLSLFNPRSGFRSLCSETSLSAQFKQMFCKMQWIYNAKYSRLSAWAFPICRDGVTIFLNAVDKRWYRQMELAYYPWFVLGHLVAALFNIFISNWLRGSKMF